MRGAKPENAIPVQGQPPAGDCPASGQGPACLCGPCPLPVAQMLGALALPVLLVLALVAAAPPRPRVATCVNAAAIADALAPTPETFEHYFDEGWNISGTNQTYILPDAVAYEIGDVEELECPGEAVACYKFKLLNSTGSYIVGTETNMSHRAALDDASAWDRCVVTCDNDSCDIAISPSDSSITDKYSVLDVSVDCRGCGSGGGASAGAGCTGGGEQDSATLDAIQERFHSALTRAFSGSLGRFTGAYPRFRVPDASSSLDRAVVPTCSLSSTAGGLSLRIFDGSTGEVVLDRYMGCEEELAVEYEGNIIITGYLDIPGEEGSVTIEILETEELGGGPDANPGDTVYSFSESGEISVSRLVNTRNTVTVKCSTKNALLYPNNPNTRGFIKNGNFICANTEVSTYFPVKLQNQHTIPELTVEDLSGSNVLAVINFDEGIILEAYSAYFRNSPFKDQYILPTSGGIKYLVLSPDFWNSLYVTIPFKNNKLGVRVNPDPTSLTFIYEKGEGVFGTHFEMDMEFYTVDHNNSRTLYNLFYLKLCVRAVIEITMDDGVIKASLENIDNVGIKAIQKVYPDVKINLNAWNKLELMNGCPGASSFTDINKSNIKLKRWKFEKLFSSFEEVREELSEERELLLNDIKEIVRSIVLSNKEAMTVVISDLSGLKHGEINMSYDNYFKFNVSMADEDNPITDPL